MYLLIVGSAGTGIDRLRGFIQTKNPGMVDLTATPETVRLPGGTPDPMDIFVKTLNAHCETAKARLRGYKRDLVLAYSMWEWWEVDKIACLPKEYEFFAEMYRDMRDKLPPPDAVLELRTDFQKAAAFSAMSGYSLTHVEFDEREARLDEFVAKLQAPVEQVTMESPEVDAVLEQVLDIYESFQNTYNGPKTIWSPTLFRPGE